MKMALLFALACASAAFMPLMSESGEAASETSAEAGIWPARWDGATIRPLPLTPEEKRFTGAFPGTLARFTDGSREILFRRVAQPTRKLHPSADCLRAIGYAVTPLPAETDSQGRTWSRLKATRLDVSLEVKELVVDNAGRTWSDVPSWYWHAVWGKTPGPWTAVTVSRRLPMLAKN